MGLCVLSESSSLRLDFMAVTAAGATLEELSALAEGVSYLARGKIPEPGAYRNSGGERVTYFTTCPCHTLHKVTF
jgi:hypothetical protein